LPLFAVLFCLFLIQTPSLAYGWGWEAHKLICAVAQTQLTPKATRMVDQYLAEGTELKGGVVPFPEACLWADDTKYSTRQDAYEHHFINVPDNAMTIDLARDCEAINCTIVGLQRALTYLTRETDGDRAIKRRAAALRYLGHYVGDLHQPMHVGNASDWGGNKIKINWYGEKTNLHAIWDYKMPEGKMRLTYPDSVAFLSSIKPLDNGNPILAWFDESLALGRSHAYSDHQGKLIKSGQTLGDDYFNRNKPVVIERMTLAAKRLADLLNAVAAGNTPRVVILSPAPAP
jgi:hypothetical protein